MFHLPKTYQTGLLLDYKLDYFLFHDTNSCQEEPNIHKLESIQDFLFLCLKNKQTEGTSHVTSSGSNLAQLQ